MELFVRFLLLTVKFVALLLQPLQNVMRMWTRCQLKDNHLPAITNRLLTYSLQELRSRLRARQVRNYAN